jgi:hypothetical protein
MKHLLLAIAAVIALASGAARAQQMLRPAVRTFSARQIEAIRMTTIAGLAGDYCLEIVGADYALGQELINAGIEVSDFGTPEYERIRRDAKAALDSEPNASRCGGLWNLFGPGGSYGRELVRRRRPNDPPYVWGKR